MITFWLLTFVPRDEWILYTFEYKIILYYYIIPPEKIFMWLHIKRSKLYIKYLLDVYFNSTNNKNPSELISIKHNSFSLNIL